MPTSPHKEHIRASWKRRQLAGAPARVWLVLRRTIATLIALGLIGICGWLLFRLFWVPNTYFAYLTATTYQPGSGQPLAFASKEFAAIEALNAACAWSDVPDPFQKPLTKELLKKRLGDLAQLEMHGKDTLIVYLTAHGVVRGKTAYLVCEPAEGSSAEDSIADIYYPVSELLDALRQVSAKTKLLILDAGRDNDVPRFSLAMNTFPMLLERALQDGDPDHSLWVLSANGPLERSHVSHSLKRSIFGYLVSHGMRGAADEDEDEVIQLDELYRYVQSGVSQWVKETTSARESQTPLLFHCDVNKLESNQLEECVLLSVSGLEAEEAEQDGSASAPTLRELASEQLKEAPKALDPITAKVGAGSAADGRNGAAGDGAKKSEGSTGEAPASATLSRRSPRQLLEHAWKLVARLEKAGAPHAPGVVAPPLWRELVDRLRWHEDAFTVGIPHKHPKWAQFAGELASICRSLEAFATGDGLNAANGNLVDRIELFLPPAPLGSAPDGHISIALLEEIAANDPSRPLSKLNKDFLVAYDAWLAKGDNATFESLQSILPKTEDGKPDSAAIDRLFGFYELQLVDHLRANPEVDWRLARLVFSTRRASERAAANMLCGEGWARETIDEADRLRWEGERLILDRTKNNWEEFAKEKLDDAGVGYEKATTDLDFVGRMVEQRNQLLYRSPDYVRWAQLSRGDRNEHDLHVSTIKDLLKLLGALNIALASPGNDSFDKLHDLDRQISKEREALEKLLAPSADAWRIANLLATRIPAADERPQLRLDLARREKQFTASFDDSDSQQAADPSPPLAHQWKTIRKLLELEIDLARLVGYADVTIELESTSDDSDAEFCDKLNDECGRFGELYDKLPEPIASISNSTTEEDRDKRSNRLSMLRTAICPWLLLDVQHRRILDPAKNNLSSILEQAAWHDLLVWQSTRFNRAAVDAPVREVDYLRSTAETHRNLANSIPGATVAPYGEPPLQFVETTTGVSLVKEESKDVSFKLRANGEKRILLAAQFNPDHLQITGKLPSTSAEYPTSRDSPGLNTTEMVLPAGEATDFTINVKRLPNARGVTTLILKAITADTTIRHELEVELTGRELLDFTVNDGPEFWSRSKEGVVLHPLPNHAHRFSFSVINLDKVSKTLEVSLLIPGKVPAKESLASLSAGAQKTETAELSLQSFDTRLLGRVFKIVLPDSKKPVLLDLLAADPKLDERENLLLPEGQDPEKFPGISLPRGLLVKLEDKENKQVTIRRIQIMPQRPGNFLKAWADYNRNTNRLQIRVEAPNPNILPARGIQLSAKIEGKSAQQGSDLEGVLKRTAASDSMYAYISDNAPQDITAVVHVHGDPPSRFYPRAFIFRVPRSATKENIPPLDNATEVRIVSPQHGAPYNARKVKSIPVTLEIDAPDRVFSGANNRAIVEVGIDDERNRVLQDDADSVLTLRSDRSVAVVAKSLSADGTLTLDAQVNDFVLALQTTGLSDETAYLLGRLVIDGTSTWSKPVEIILDGSGPAIHAELHPGRQIEIDSVLEVRVVNDPPDRSKIQTVEVVFDAEGAKPVPAKLRDLETWVAKLPTKDLVPGPHTVLIRAIDKVENESEVLRESVQIIPKKAASQSNAPAGQPDDTNSVSGQVVYGNQAVGATVTLHSSAGAEVARGESKEDGRFLLTKIPPGEYTLTVESLAAVRNKVRRANLKVTVLKRPARATTVSVSLE